MLKNMRIGFTADFLTIERISLIIIAYICYILGILLLVFSEAGALLMIVFLLLSIVFVVKPKVMIYIIIFSIPFLTVLAQYTSLKLGGSRYLSINLGGIFAIAGLTIGSIVLIIKKVNIFKYRLTVPIILFFGTYLVSVFTSPLGVFLLSLRCWVRFAMSAVIYFLILELFNDIKRAERLLKLVLLFFIPTIFVGFWQMFFHVSKSVESISPDVTLYRISGTGDLANTFAMMLLTFLLLTFCYYNNSRTRHKWIYLILFFNMIVLLFATYVRIVWVAFIAAISMIGIMRYRVFYMSFVLVGVFIFMTVSPVREQMILRIQSKGSVGGRLQLAKIGFNIFKQRPVLGYGPGTVTLLYRPVLKVVKQDPKTKQYALRETLSSHNDYVRTLVEGGIVNLLAYLFLIFTGFRLSFKVYKLPYSDIKNYGLFLIAFIVSMLIFGITDMGFEFAHTYFFFFLAIGEIYLRSLQPQPQLHRMKAV